ncbi:hypothetical protein GGF38_004320, partial [Coemansia sp. RSA 25]
MANNNAPPYAGNGDELLRPVLSPTPTPTPTQQADDDSFPDILPEQWRTPDTLGLDASNNHGQIFYFASNDERATTPSTTTAMPQLDGKNDDDSHIKKLAEVDEKQQDSR